MAHAIYPAPADRAQLAGRAILTATVQSLDDALTDPSYNHAFAAAGSWRRVMGAPMLKDGVAVGAILVGWPEAGHTPTRQIELIRTFADQAVIAIENVRLLNETKEALERQTATAEILKVIASSPDDVQPVFDAIAASSNRLLGGHSTAVWRFRDEAMHLVGFTPTTPEGDAALLQLSGTALDRSQFGQRDRRWRNRLHRPTPKTKPSRRRGARGRPRTRLSQHGAHPAAARRRLDRHAQRHPPRARTVHAAPDRAAPDLRRPGGDRDRERAPLQRDQGGARAADRDGRDPAGDLAIADRRPAGVRRDRRARAGALRRAHRRRRALRRQAGPHGRLPRRVTRGDGNDAGRLPDAGRARLGPRANRLRA